VQNCSVNNLSFQIPICSYVEQVRVVYNNSYLVLKRWFLSFQKSSSLIKFQK